MRVNADFVIVVAFLVYVTAVAKLSPGLPKAVADVFGVSPMAAFAGLIVVPGIGVLIARTVLARRSVGGPR